MKLFCKKCGSEHNIEKWGHSYCPNCGVAYDHVIIGEIKEIENSPLYLKICEIHNQWTITNGKNKEYDLISKIAWIAILRLVNDFRDQIAYKFRNSDDTFNELILKYQEELGLIIIGFIIDGYFAWIAEQIISGNAINPSQVSEEEQFIGECCNNYDNFIYKDFFKHLQGSNDKGVFSKESARIFSYYAGFVWGELSKRDNVSELSEFFTEISKTCIAAMIAGYTVAIEDNKYRK
ncbi:MAG: hypothetical protein A2312_01505 [Candidatus Staskawiczbacteria bacterium RIFOXYB2_FULL_32_9]|nr:MAG: hypothetical protein A2312_01505 [Candidatus Staskawiczbacteria bacterium RIFOXYB2_FULL_32_9]